jgi:type IV pilus assembly protein PilO
MKKDKSKLSADSVSPFIEKIEHLSKVQRIFIIIAVFAILLGGFTSITYYPKYQKIKDLEKEYEKQKEQLENAKKNAKELNSYRAKMKEVEKQFQIVKQALPEKEEIPSLLASISQSGMDSGLEFLLFQPQNEVERDFFAEIPVSISVTGRYHELARFFDKVGNLPRIVNIRNILIDPEEGGETLTTKCSAVTYKFVESKPKGKKSKGKKSKKKKKSRKKK